MRSNLSALLLATVFAFSLCASSASAAGTHTVVCSGSHDEDQIQLLIDNDTTINIQGDCVLSYPIYADNVTGLVIQGVGDSSIALGADFHEYGLGVIDSQDINFTLSNLRLIDNSPAMVGNERAALSGGGNINLTINNVTFDDFGVGIAYNGDNNVIVATDFAIINTGTIDYFGLTTGVPIVFTSSTNNSINWISGISDAPRAVHFAELSNPLGPGITVTIAGQTVTSEDFELYFEGMFRALSTKEPINRLVNCGFPVGSKWDTCPDTGGGGDIGVPETGHFASTGGAVMSIALTVLAATSLATVGFALIKRKLQR